MYTLVRLLARMYARVSFQVGRADERSCAFIALERFFTGVRHDMSLEIILLDELSATNVTLVRFLAGVCAHVRS